MFGLNSQFSKILIYPHSNDPEKGIKEQSPMRFSFSSNKTDSPTQEQSSHQRVYHPLYIK